MRRRPICDKIMLKTIRFFKIAEGPQSGWYADVPNHTLEENQMVYGSDLFLEAVDKLNGGRNEVSITVSDNNDSREFIAKLIMKAHNQHGATYIQVRLQKDTEPSGSNSGSAM